MRKTMFGAAVLAAMMTVPAVAGTVTKTFTFDTTNFTDVQGIATTIPYSSVIGSFTVTFDPTLNYNSDTTDITINSFSGVPVTSQLGFSYFASDKDLFFGGIENSSNYIYADTNDFGLALDVSNLSAPRAVTCNDPGITCGNATGNAGVLASGYASTLYPNSFFLEVASATTISAVPEPITWVMMVAGIGVIGASMRQRRAVTTRLQHV